MAGKKKGPPQGPLVGDYQKVPETDTAYRWWM